jgi:antitoxin HicB
MRRKRRGSIGSLFDDYLREEGLYEQTQATAIKRMLARQITQAMKEKQITKTDMARRMATSRTQLDRLLDPENDSLTLTTLARAAKIIGRRVKVELI